MLFTADRDGFNKLPAITAGICLVRLVRGDGFGTAGIGISPGRRLIAAGVLQSVMEVKNDAEVRFVPVAVVMPAVMTITVSAPMVRIGVMAAVKMMAAVKTVRTMKSGTMAAVTIMA